MWVDPGTRDANPALLRELAQASGGDWFRLEDPLEISCYPFNFIGNAPKRFIVRAERMPARPLTSAME